MVLPIEARDSLTLKFSILLNAQQECTEHAIRSFLCSHLKPDFQTLGMYTYCTVIIKLNFTEKEKKLICLHFEVSIFSSIAPDCQNSMICTPLTLLSNNEFPLICRQLRPTYFLIILHIQQLFQYLLLYSQCSPKILFQGSQYRLMGKKMKKWTRQTNNTTLILSSRQNWKGPQRTFLKHTLTFSLEKVKFNIWDEMSFERRQNLLVYFQMQTGLSID